jgi:hypothetical protein
LEFGAWNLEFCYNGIMTPRKKTTSVKIQPLEGKFFDIKPPIEGVHPPASRTRREFFRFFCIAFTVFMGLSFSSIYMEGKDLTASSEKYAMAGYDSLQNAVQSLTAQDMNGASMWFQSAEASFQELAKSTRYLTSQANHLINQSLYLDTADKLIESGILVSQMGQRLIELAENIKQIPQRFIQGDSDLVSLIHEKQAEFDDLFQDVLVLQRNITTLNSSVLPAYLREKVAQAQDQIGQLIAVLMEADKGFDTALKLLGDKVPHRYLILLQNNHELRATGGFLGSYMIIDINDGAITKMEANDVYQTDGQLTDVVKPPAGIDQVADRWFMRDANYSPDFPTSAEQIMWFLEHSRGPSVDTVIALDQNVVEGLLKITGPVRLKNFPFQIRADNFNDMISFYIEAKLSDTATPKQLLFDLVPVFKEKLFSLENAIELAPVLKTMAEERHVQVYSKDPQVQSLAEKFRIDGKMIAPAPKTDFLALVTTSIGGNKSDQYIKTDIDHHTEISHTGLIMDSLEITKSHTWSEKDFAVWQELVDIYGTGKAGLETLKFIQGAGDNTDYMRVYVPLGSQLVKSDGVGLWDVEIVEDMGYTVFSFMFGPVSAGTNKTVKLQYELPYSLSFYPTDTYRFVAQKQAGAENITLNKTLVTADMLNVVKSYPPSDSAFSLMPVVKMDFDRNQIFLTAISSVIQ